MTFISHLINKRIANLISRFDVPKVPPHMVEEIIVDKIQIDKQHTTTN